MNGFIININIKWYKYIILFPAILQPIYSPFHFQLMDHRDMHSAQGIPCAFKQYEVFRNGRWETVTNGIPTDMDRIRYWTLLSTILFVPIAFSLIHKKALFIRLFNRGWGIRTPIDGFGDRCSTIELIPYILFTIIHKTDFLSRVFFKKINFLKCTFKTAYTKHKNLFLTRRLHFRAQVKPSTD